MLLPNHKLLMLLEDYAQPKEGNNMIKLPDYDLCLPVTSRIHRRPYSTSKLYMLPATTATFSSQVSATSEEQPEP